MKQYGLNRRGFVAAGAAALVAPRLALAQSSPYVVGTLFPMSGPNAEYGSLFTKGIELALEHIRADNMLKRPITMAVQDSLATPQGGAVGMTKLANVDKAVWVMIGFTGVSKAAAPIGTRSKVMMINGGGVGPDLAGLSPYYWNVIPLVNQEVRVLLPWLQKEKLKRIALIYVDDPLGNSVVQELRKGLAETGGELVGAHSIPPATQQFAAIAARVRDSKPDAVYFASYGAQQSQIIKQLRDNGITQQIITYSAGTIPSVVGLPESEGLIVTSQVSDWEQGDEVTQRFVKDWRAKHNGDPTSYNQNYYNAMRLFALLAQGLEKAGTEVTGETLLAELQRVRRFPLVGGEGVLEDGGTMAMPLQIGQIRNGRLQKIA
ncbi:branched-chain amino acid ABC transporter substrate-binding protein [Pseudoroseomonas rhizosphaerae]|uniref:Branched-chain amino acid ABC transporter substrate-binding protein n=1 Tax=Teichococcus rhizosphaerae TaxID=1335062 RepID=A0A2C7AA12_9PROT|nr:ABC transporter substrate-binding protein [Pseudoroseomonas rhizosphaerae]PHK95220.1 branched-chain amino acid ABC transporter substrate-binding protein [Pseudoroseomonas rhizosphaerae]